jgi:hypothetical protein
MPTVALWCPNSLKRNLNALDTSGKSVASRHHREDCMARADKPAAGFFFDPTLARGCFNSSKPSLYIVGNSFTNWKRLVHRDIPSFRRSYSQKQNFLLTRRANHCYKAIIARTIESPRGDIRGGLFVCRFTHRTAAARHDAASSPYPVCVGSQPVD